MTRSSNSTFARLRKVIVRTLAAAFALAALAGAGLAVRLAQGPVPLPFLAPRIEEALSSIAPGALANVGHVELVWSRRRPEIRVLDLRLLRRNGSPIASLPALTVRPSLRAALQGRAAMSGLGLTGARVALARDADGTLKLGADAADDAEGNTAALLALLLKQGERKGTHSTDLRWIAIRDARLVLEDAALHLTWRASQAQLFLALSPDHVEIRLDGELAIEGFEHALVRELLVPLAATVDVWRDPDGELASVKFAARGSSGHVTVSEERPPVAIESLEVQGAYLHGARAVTLDQVRASLGRADLHGSARFPFDAHEPFEARGELVTLAVEDLASLWPPTVAGGTRDWIARNVRGGNVTHATFALAIPSRAAGISPMPPEAVDVRFDLEGASVTYMKEHEPLNDIRATARLTSDRFTADIKSATGSGLTVERGTLDVDLAVRPVQSKITADVRGKNTDIFAVLDRAPLFIPKKLDIAPAEVTGDGDVHLELAMPFARGVGIKDIRVKASGKLRNASAPDLFVGVGVTGGDLAITVDEARRVRVRGTAGVTEAPMIAGPVRVDVVVEPKVGATTRAHGTVAGENLDADGELTVDGHGLRTVALSKLRLDRNELSGRLARDPDGHCRLLLTGAVADIEPLITRMRAPDRDDDGETSRTPLPWDLELTVERVLTGHRGVELTSVEAQASGTLDELRTLRAAGTIAGERGGSFQVDVVTDGAERQMSLTSADGGAVAEALGFSGDIEGGQLTATAKIYGHGPARATTGDIELSEFKVVGAPLLAELLSLGSLQGIANVLSREGIPFTRARVPFHWAGETFEINEARAVGSIGLTADGAIETREGGTIDLDGQIIPAYTLNTALGKIPLLGKLLVGGEGQGIFGIVYHVAGPRSKPKTSVNPLTALAPGILRQMFVDPFSRRRNAATRVSNEESDKSEETESQPQQPAVQEPRPQEPLVQEPTLHNRTVR